MQVKGHTQINGVGAYIPPNIVKSDDLLEEVKSESFGIPKTFIRMKVGIEERRFCDENEKPSDLAIRAAQKALNDSNVHPDEIDMVIFCGIERDCCEPATAHIIQNALGIKASCCFDVANACHGFMNGISIADAMIGIGSAKHALVVTGEKGSDITKSAIKKLQGCNTSADFRRWIGALTVGDAGGAVILGKKECKDVGFKKFSFNSDSSFNELCYYYYREDGMIDGQMLMRQISTAILKLHSNMIKKTYKSLRWKPSDISKLVSHQVGWQPHVQLSEAAGVSMDKTTTTITYHGNLTSATIPVNLYLNKPNRDEKVLLMGTGSGLSICQAGVVF
jgi:acyl-CoA:acyl-CoA alkyltransferase